MLRLVRATRTGDVDGLPGVRLVSAETGVVVAGGRNGVGLIYRRPIRVVSADGAKPIGDPVMTVRVVVASLLVAFWLWRSVR